MTAISTIQSFEYKLLRAHLDCDKRWRLTNDFTGLPIFLADSHPVNLLAVLNAVEPSVYTFLTSLFNWKGFYREWCQTTNIAGFSVSSFAEIKHRSKLMRAIRPTRTKIPQGRMEKRATTRNKTNVLKLVGVTGEKRTTNGMTPFIRGWCGKMVE
ncbi:uncharacterized protein KY384_004495 [Bacidia gigantensis]|uniref:uncharacterized protein n=1 Tax=Bacidia gigantensis TaxID=2732470 RepID=UPI001D041DEE|nr:uncharacterized protein KY384_004495 [Bacidia gigantensis]KAG8531137.1 hypothetical protein KY384_004495 [Bacidia gigantensis]